MFFGIQVATVQAKLLDARRPLVFGRAFAHLDGSNERIPGAAAPILFHGTPGENREDSTPALLNTLNKFILDCSVEENRQVLKTPLSNRRLVNLRRRIPQTPGAELEVRVCVPLHDARFASLRPRALAAAS